ncbi:formin-like protein [Encephalitozoon intestinalis ATCC 50506]|uniref:Formin-like protein n=1 Tax=Encephalitozoon intestinalis (strain ATCC 50506) TaxID=876142 RepID=E0S9R0_ENCIT|nr:formin-like protein [Encephalitozoon intestinalis ATCC 50506]ADM12445.2 formin-like protein [Encephalitozoon intestinalis ATCC 50506]UTX46281.1 formin domain-containing protein [Encephalitozoon intestinalis]
MEGETLMNGARINSRILEKIQALVKNSEGGDFRCVGSTSLSNGSKEVYIKKERGDRRQGANLNVWRISHRVLVFGQCWDNSTESITRRNNTGELIEFLNTNYKDRFMVWSLGESLKKYPNVQKIPSLDFDLGLAYRISCAVRCWLEFNPNNIAAFETQNGDEDKLRFLVGCVLRYCELADRTELIWEKCLEGAFASSLSNINTVKRYIKYFDSASTLKGELAHTVILRQLIVTTIPSASTKSFLIGMKIMKKGEELCAIKEGDDDRVYRDKDYAVFSGVDCDISEDIQVFLYYYLEEEEKRMVLLRINTLFYRQGLYRFALDDVECFLPENRFDKEFTIDLVMIESGKAVQKPQCIHKVDLIQGLRLLNEGFWGEPDREIYERLVSEGQNEIVAKFCAFMRYFSEKTSELVRTLEAKGFRASILEAKTLKHADIVFENKEKCWGKHRDAEVEEISGEGVCGGVGIDRKALYTMENGNPKPLELIGSFSRVENRYKVKPKKIVVKKRQAEKCDAQPNVVIKKPFHWIPLSRAEETIFSETSGISTDIDYEKFEEIFCEPFSEQKKTSKETKRSIIEESRLFLASLSLKHLELRNITPENVYSILKTPDNPLGLQDLLNIEKMYPGQEEVMDLISTPPESLGKVEKAMLEFSKLLDVRKLVEILIFERRFFDEIFLIEKTLLGLLEVCNRILDSQSLRIVLRTILEIGNTMNFRYSISRKKANGFKLSSLYVFSNYRGKNNTSLFPFLFHVLEANGVRVEHLLEELSPLHDLKNEELPKIREKINHFIEIYTEKLGLLNLLEEDAKKEYAKFFRFAYSKLEEMSCSFKKFHLHSSMVKRKFGEEETKSLREILTTLSDFLNSTKQELGRYRKTQNRSFCPKAT